MQQSNSEAAAQVIFPMGLIAEIISTTINWQGVEYPTYDNNKVVMTPFLNKWKNKIQRPQIKRNDLETKLLGAIQKVLKGIENQYKVLSHRKSCSNISEVIWLEL